MRIGSSKEIKKIDKSSIEEYGIPSIVLMENAALSLQRHLLKLKEKTFTIICGCGNNGGDGLALARLLLSKEKQVKIFVIDNLKGLSKDCKINYDILIKLGIKVTLIKNSKDITYLKEEVSNSDIIIDAIFGIGLSREINGIYVEVIKVINDYSKYILAIDVPSGLNSDTGEVLGICVKANTTITFELYKTGFLNYKSHQYTGNIILEQINIPKNIIEKNHDNIFMTNKELVCRYIPKRNKYSHKGEFGKILIFAGSVGFSGAAFISTEAAVRAGGGLVTLACHKDIQPILCEKLVEAMTVSYDDYYDVARKSSAIAFGPGMGNSKNTLDLLKTIISNYNKPLVIDADGLNVLENNLDLLEKYKERIVITPHLGEMSRITGYSIEYIEQNKIEVAKEFANKHNVIVLLKGYNTIITDGRVTYVNPTGNSAMASGGMGDCLTGIIVSLIGQKVDAFKATIIGAFIHGYIGDKLSKSMYSVNATHILNEIPYILKEMQI